MTDLRTGRATTQLVWASFVCSVLALLLSGWAFVASLDDDERERTVEERLTCLELPGANDCGLDGR
jgi:hypothetical protein